MTRWWDEFVAAVGDHVPGGVPVLAVILLLLTALTSLLIYTWPAWLPSRWWRRLIPRRRARREKRGRAVAADEAPEAPEPEEPVVPEDEAVPDVPAVVLTLSADQLAESGRYAEAVRERLRAIVRDLIERQVIENRAGYTVTELATAAITARPDLAGPLGAAGATFSEIWYALRPATAADDAAMREHAARIHAILMPVPGSTA
ncbi:hypothetical protein GCM10009682_46020 [Luedemannella flava]|uniref:Protein-glutamine gamma-glutamyltransferase-like C-terminal domain-containing protein n=1 Tax=Luedemannella flava TaxID=349316 RepID=A0ABP4YQQ7_9ACTN